MTTPQQPTEADVQIAIDRVKAANANNRQIAHVFNEPTDSTIFQDYDAIDTVLAALAASRRDRARLDALNNPQIACQVYWSHEREAWVHSVSVTSEQLYDTVQEAIDAAAKGAAE